MTCSEEANLQTESTLVVAQGPEGMWAVTAKAHELSFRDDAKILKQVVVTHVHSYTTLNILNTIELFTCMAYCMVYELYLRKVFI